MENRIQLKHPAGKKAVTMNSTKYNLLKKEILAYLNENGESTHKKMLQGISKSFGKSKTKFEGSVEWHMEWVKLDLEARKVIVRNGNVSPVTFAVKR